MRKYSWTLFAVVVVASAVLACSSTIRTSRMSLVTVTVGGQRTATLSIEPLTPWLKAKLLFSRVLAAPAAQAAIPANVNAVRLAVSGSGMADITAQQSTAGQTDIMFQIEVPNGQQRYFVVEGLDASLSVVYRGQAVRDLDGTPVTIDIAMANAVPPVFSGLQSVVPSLSSIQLIWRPATDDTTPQGSIVYLIYQAFSPGAEDFSSPSYTTSPGATSYTISNPAPGTTFYFVVRARDAEGNIDTNTIERSANSLGKYVLASSGVDTLGCGTLTNPCRTITYALSQSVDNETLYVDAGNYVPSGAAPGEAFPLQLKPGTQLLCTGADFGTKLDNSAGIDSTIIIGASGVLVNGCALYTTPSSTYAVIDDGGSAMTINNCFVSSYDAGLGISAVTGIELTGNSIVSNSTISGFPGSDGGGAGIRTSLGAVISANTITATWDGIFVSAGTSTVSNNTLSGNNTGVIINGGSPSILNNTIFNNGTYGIEHYSTATQPAAISGNDINNNYMGITVGAGTPSITGNRIHHNTTGMYLFGGTPAIHNNFIYCNNTVSNFINYGDVYISISGLDITLNSWDHDGTTIPSGPTVQVYATMGCTAGTDICMTGNMPAPPIYSPFNAAVAGGCP